MPMASYEACIRLSTFLTNKLKVLPNTATNNSAAVLSLARKKSHKKRHSLHELSNKANCSLRNMLSSEYLSSDFWDACGMIIEASISLSMRLKRLPSVNTVLRLRIVGFDENNEVLGLSSEPSRSSLSATSSS